MLRSGRLGTLAFAHPTAEVALFFGRRHVPVEGQQWPNRAGHEQDKSGKEEILP
jgi:hypothetical protein